MVRVQVIAYAPTDFLEEPDTTIGRCRELVEKNAVTWVNVVDPDERTLDELETLFGFHPLALEDAQNEDLHPKVEVYDDTVFIVVRTIVWMEEIETDQLSIFLGKKFVVTIHDKVFPQLEDIRSDPDERTLDELETLFGFHPLALEDAQNEDLHPKVEVYDDTVFIVVRTIVWMEEIETDQLSIFLGKKFVVTIHDKVFPQLEDIRIRLRKRTPRILKAGSDFLAYTILDVLVDSYFPHLDRFQSLLDQLEEQIVARPSGMGIAHLHDVRTDLVRLRNDLRPQRDIFGVLS